MDMLQPSSAAADDPFALADDFSAFLAEKTRANELIYFRELSSNDGMSCESESGRLLMLGSNNYLGLTADPYVRQKTCEAVMANGPSMTGSRFLNGTTPGHTQLEAAMARFLGREAGIVFTTGYQANVGLLSALTNSRTYLVLDRSCHASILDGARVAGCRVVRFQHNEPEHLAATLRKLPSSPPPLVMVDGVYSMEGEVAPIPELHAVCRKYGARFVIDDAHGLGTLGVTGRGTEEYFDMIGCADAVTGTFSKSLASIGGFVVARRALIDWIRFNARPMIFSASLPPGSVAAAHAALQRLEESPALVTRLTENARHWRAGLERLGLDVIPAPTPVVAIRIGDTAKCIELTADLMRRGVFVNAAIPPSVANGHAVIRTSVTALHSPELLDRALELMAQSVKALDVPTAGRAQAAGALNLEHAT
jgi:8-amino-7-oxononanoate synthase